MTEQNNAGKEVALENIITSAVQIPGVKVSRDKFLAETFATEDVIIQDVLDFGPVEAKVSKEKLAAISNKLILKRTSQSSVASFAAGIPGGLAMAATIPIYYSFWYVVKVGTRIVLPIWCTRSLARWSG